jgi:hypothetical protein
MIILFIAMSNELFHCVSGWGVRGESPSHPTLNDYRVYCSLQ